ncbi:hypothetical protein LIER_17290 [Lithospermum erythrorhizon]|uniref:Uncharacterized protein n=1 Tax=Lithospermum erythrorhizon TaxID=34254 RepID=A0AAV3QF77_LITER
MEADIICSLQSCKLTEEEEAVTKVMRRILRQEFMSVKPIQVKGLPPMCYTREVAAKIMQAFKTCEVLEMKEKEEDGHRLFRVRAWVASLPL